MYEPIFMQKEKFSRFKKKLNAEYDERSVTRNIMNIIGLSLNDSGEVIDQDTGVMLTMNSKILLYNFDHPMPPRENIEIYFDLVNNNKLVYYLFDYFISKMNIEIMNISVESASIQKEDGSPYGYEYVLNVIFPNGLTVSSNKYNILSFGYLDLIFRLSGQSIPSGLFDLNDKLHTQRMNKKK